jgi:hypothetical protein
MQSSPAAATLIPMKKVATARILSAVLWVALATTGCTPSTSPPPSVAAAQQRYQQLIPAVLAVLTAAYPQLQWEFRSSLDRPAQPRREEDGTCHVTSPEAVTHGDFGSATHGLTDLPGLLNPTLAQYGFGPISEPTRAQGASYDLARAVDASGWTLELSDPPVAGVLVMYGPADCGSLNLGQ